MRQEDYIEYERARLEGLRRQGVRTGEDRRRAELLKQLTEVLDTLQGRLSGELLSELKEELAKIG